MNFPTNVKYTSEHEWIRIEGDEAIVGITDYAQDQLGDIVFASVLNVSWKVHNYKFRGLILIFSQINKIPMIPQNIPTTNPKITSNKEC